MKRLKAYVRGAYGPGNLGDDVLMVATLNVLKMRFKPQDIGIGVDHPLAAAVFEPLAKWMPIKEPFRSDLVVLGGGGQFFSFRAPANIRPSRLQALRSSIAAQSSLLDTAMRLAFKATGAIDGLYFAKHVGTFCIGLGPFQVEGKGKQRATHFLRKAEYLSVRDATSAGYCADLGGKTAEVFSDPSLLPELWYGELTEPLRLADRSSGYYSFVLREWALDQSGMQMIDAMLTAAAKLRDSGEKVRLVSLYRERDASLIANNQGYEWLVWDPGTDTIASFMQRLCTESAVIVSARAHGVWLPAALGVPSVAIRIENKLEEVHRMLGQGTLLVKEPNADSVLSAIEQFFDKRDALAAGVLDDVRGASDKVRESVKSILTWIDSTGTAST